MGVGCPFIVVSAWMKAETVNFEMKIVKTVDVIAGSASMVVNPRVKVKLEPWLMDMRPWMEIKDMDAGYAFMVVNPWVKVDEVTPGGMEAI
jgi:hypothetical protein